MKAMGIFEVKTKLSQVCEDIARTGESIIVTKRGKPFVRIEPISPSAVGSEVWEARERYRGRLPEGEEFVPPPREAETAYNPFNEKDQ